MKYLIVKTLITGMLLTSAGQVSALTNDYESCITTASWVSNGNCYGKFTNKGDKPTCHRVRFTPSLMQFSSLAIQQQLHSTEPVTLEPHQHFTFHVQYRGHSTCSARVNGAGPG